MRSLVISMVVLCVFIVIAPGLMKLGRSFGKYFRDASKSQPELEKGNDRTAESETPKD